MKLSPLAKGLILVLVLVLLAGSLIFINRILAGDLFNHEEARHGLFGLWIWRDITSLDWQGFWYDTGRQMVWPFLHSWLLGGFFLFFGVSYASARLLSLVLFLTSIVLVYSLATRFDKEAGWKIGSLTVVLMLTSPLLLRFAVLNMTETLGALLFIIAAYVYQLSDAKKLLLHYVLLGLLIGLSIYTNYAYALLMLPAFLVVSLVKLGPLGLEALQLKQRGEPAALPFIWWAYRKLILLAVALLLAGLWFSFNFSRRFMLFLDVLMRSAPGQAHNWLLDLGYYPQVILRDLSFSPWLGLLFLLALFLPQVARRFPGLKNMYVFVWTVLLLATLIMPAKNPQMIYIIVPFILLIFSAAVFYLLERLLRRDRKQAALLLLALLVPALISVPRLASLYRPMRPAGNLAAVLDFYQAQLPPAANLAANFNLAVFDNDVIKFHLRDPDQQVLDPDQVASTASAGQDVYYLTMQIDVPGPYQNQIIDDSLYRWNYQLNQQETTGQISLIAFQRFDNLGLSAKIYKKK